MARLALYLVAVLFSAPASAALAPLRYEEARTNAVDVVVIAVAGVTPPSEERRWGDCQLSGVVHKVERGTRYSVGAPITLAVPCAYRDGDYPDGGAIYQEMDSLLGARYGRAFLDAEGKLSLSQFDQLASPGASY